MPHILRISAIVLLAAATVAGRSPQPQDVVVDKDVVFVTSAKLAMDIARPAAGVHPAVVTIGGVSFRTVDKGAHDAFIRALAAWGYVAASVNYRLGARNQFPVALQDVKAAVRFLRANAEKYAIDPNRICAIGESAGATLALLAAFTPGVADFESGGNRDQSSALSCVVAASGIGDFTTAYTGAAAANTDYPPFLGGDAAHARQAHAIASPVNWITPAAPPVLLMHARQDPIVPAAQTDQLAARLRAAGVAVETVIRDGPEHGLALLTANEVARTVFSFLDDRLGVAPPRQVVLVADHGPRQQIVAMEWPSGRELWTMPNAGGHDVQPLPDGHVLFTMGSEKKVVEVDDKLQPVWTYGPDEGVEHPITAERLANGNTLIGDAVAGRVFEVTPDKKVVWEYKSEDLGKMRMRNARRTSAGTTLISVEAAGKIIEVNNAGEIVWTYEGVGGATRRPYKGMRLPNGNTLVSMTDPGELVEVDRAGKIVREIGGQKLDIRMIWTSGFDLLPNGNLLISDYLGRRLIEVDASGAVVNELRMPTRTTASIAVVK